jgi:hypothetical protein
LDNIDIAEIHELIHRYQCEKDSQIILDNLCNSNRINKAKMNRQGFNDKNIQAAVTRLKLALSPFEE